MRFSTWLLTILIICEVAVAGVTASTQFVGRTVCVNCHARETAQWSDSHHDLAMQPASAKTVLGDFDNATLTHFGVKSSFFRKNDKYTVRTEGPEGKLQDYEIKYAFGVEPLQQYLIEFPGGRLQALSLAWDTRPKEQGGQRWFHLYPDENITHSDELHWTRPSQNWNSMCAECHSTHLEKKYDPVAMTFSTSWSEIDVSCEACHGPGSEHVVWAAREPGWKKLKVNKGLTILLDERKHVRWQVDANTGNAVRSEVRKSDNEIEICARCHARRSPISDGYVHGEPLLDHYMPRLLDGGMYFPDGQIDGEVYVYGSFIQSKMFQAGVTCSDCHEPHSLGLRATGNGVCLQCHQATKYDHASHHHHKLGSQGASCAECHMPSKTYMVVDPRHDHSIRIPRPDLSVELGTPNACTNCHQDKDAAWAAKQIKTWYGDAAEGFQTYAGAFNAARNEQPGTRNTLAVLIRDTTTPDIARATALSQIGPHLNPARIDVLTLGVYDDNPMVRRSAVSMLEYAPLEIRGRVAFAMLDDPVRAVRMEAARVLAPLPAGDLTTDQRSLMESGVEEYISAQHAMAERAEAQANLGNLYGALGESEQAVSAFETAIGLNPAYAPAYINLADLYRAQANEAQADSVLRRGIKLMPDNADIRHALGLSLVRQGYTEEAIEELKLASSLNPDNVRYVYVYAVALNSTGKAEQAVVVLQRAHNQHPNNTDILGALVAFYRDMGNQGAARIYADKLRAISP